jgi:M6 family metalloprotease-like protein
MIAFVALVAANTSLTVNGSPQIGVSVTSTYQYGVVSGTHNATGPKRVLVILVEFQDVMHKHSASHIETIIFNQLNEYYSQISYGKLSITGQAYGWEKVNHPLAYYGRDHGSTEDVNSDLLASDVLSQVPHDEADRFDFLMIVHAGDDQARSGRADDIWSSCSCAVFPEYSPPRPVHSGSWSFSSYALLSELDGLGTFAHEFGHYLGLPDLYDATTRRSYIGYWSLMDSGNTCCTHTSEETPSYVGAWGATLLGWLSPAIVQDSIAVSAFRLEPLESSEASALLIPLSANTYYFIEYRTQAGFDRHLPTAGILVYFVDELLDTGEGIVRLINPATGHLMPQGSPDSFDSAAFSNGGHFDDAADQVYMAFLQSSNVFTALYSTEAITSEVFSSSALLIRPQFEGRYNDIIALNGTLMDTEGSGLDGQAVEILLLDTSSGIWQKIGTATTTGGQFSFPFSASYNTGDYQLRVLYPGGQVGSAWYMTSSEEFSIRILPAEMKITISHPEATVGDLPVWLYVTSNRGTPVSDVHLTVYVDGAQQATLISDQDGRASFVIHVSTPQIWSTLRIEVKGERANFDTVQSGITVAVSPPIWIIPVAASTAALIILAFFEARRMKSSGIFTGKRYQNRGPICPTCGFANRHGALYCVRDRTALTQYYVRIRFCARCGYQNTSSASYCIACGKRMR